MKLMQLFASLKNRLAGLFPTGNFTRGAAVIVSGTVIGQSLVILSSPLLTRLYTPEDFGTLAVYAAILAFVILIASLRYELSILLPEEDHKAINLLALSLFSLFIVGGISTLGVVLFGEQILQWTNTENIKPYLWALPVGIILGGANKVFTYWALRNKTFSLIARTRIQKGGGMAGSQLVFGYMQWGAIGLIFGHIIGYTAGLISLIRYSVKTAGHSLRSIKFREILAGAKRYRKFPLFTTWSDMANVGGTQLPLILFSSLFSPTVAGFYMLAHRVANAPASLVSEGIGKAFMTTAVEAQRNNQLPELALNVYSLLLRIGLGPLLIITVIAPDFFAVVFGKEWIEAGYYLQWMAPWLASVFIFSPISSLFSVMEIQQMDFFFQTTLLVSRVSALFLGAYLGGPILAVALYATSAAVVYFGFGTWLLHRAGVKYWDLFKNIAKELIYVAPIGIVLLILRWTLDLDTPSIFDPSSVLLISVAILLGILILLRVKPALKDISQLGSQKKGES